MCESFSLISQKWEQNLLSFTISFKPTAKSYLITDFSMVFQNDISVQIDQETISSFDVPCEFSKENDGSITVICKGYSFDESLHFDQLTNFSCFRILNNKIDFDIPIPTYCGSQDGKNLIIELYSPF